MMGLMYVQAWTQEHQNLAFFFILCSCSIQGCLCMLMPMLMRVLASLVRTGLIVQCTWIIPHCILFVIHFKGVISLKTTSLWWCPPVSDPKHFVDMTMSMINAGTRHQHHPDQFRFLRNCPPTPSRQRFSLAASYFWQPWLDDHISSLLSRVPKFSLPLPLLTPATQANILDVTHATLTLVDVHRRMIWLLLLLLAGFQHQSRPWHGFQTHFSPGKCIVLNHDVFDLIFNIIYVVWSDQLKCSSK